MDALWRDVRFAWRTLVRRPAFAGAVVATFAIGIGGNVGVFSTLHAALMRAVPFRDPDSLVLGRATRGGRLNPLVAAPDYFDYRERSTSFTSLGAVLPLPRKVTISGDGEPERVRSGMVSYDLFPTLGVAPVLGRAFSADEGREGAPPVAIISYGLWQRRYAGSPSVLDASLSINGSAPVPIIGVLPPGYRLIVDADVWTPMRPGGPFADARRFHNWLLVGRLKPGVTLAQAQGEVDAISRDLQREYPESNADKWLRLDPLRAALVESLAPRVTALMGAVLLLLLIACSNVANLLLVRGSSRRAELAVRGALGAPRGRLVRQLLVESLVLAAVGGALGVGIAVVLQRLLPSLTRPDGLPLTGLGINVPVLGFALVLIVVAAVIAGLVPALRAVRTSLVEDLRAHARGGDQHGGSRLRGALVVAQVALSCALLAGAGLLLRNLLDLLHAELGFEPANVFVGEVQVPAASARNRAEAAEFYTRLAGELRALPGVEACGMISQLPLRDPGNNIYVWLPGEAPKRAGEEGNTVLTRSVMPGYFAAMRIPLLAGRDVSESDTAASSPVLVIDSTMARTLFGAADPIGRQVVVDLGPQPVTAEVIGVVGAARINWVGDAPEMTMYHSYWQNPYAPMRFALRTRVDAAAASAAVAGVVRRLNPAVATEPVQRMDEVIAASLGQQRLLAAMVGVFALVAVLLTAVGIYGVVSYTVSLRSHEIGIRMALGGSPGSVFRTITGAGLRLAAGGGAIGLAVAAAAGRVLAGALPGVRAVDPLVDGAVVLVLAGASFLACLMPARRAAALDPAAAMRWE